MHLETSVESSVSADPTRFVYGGVAFDISTAPSLAWELGKEHRRFLTAYDAGPAAVAVRVAASAAAELAADEGREIHFAWSGSAARVRTRGARIELRELASRSFAASALISPTSNGCSSLCTALAGALIDRVGGVVLHASGIEVDGGVVIFVGPSEAGKTTAANHCQGARGFAKDRVAAYPTPLGWHVAPMSGGDEVHLPVSPHRVLPLRGVLRVCRGEAPGIRTAPLPRAIHLLRESLQMSDRPPEGEVALLDRLIEMSGEVPVGTIHTVLGNPVLPSVVEWLEGARS